MSIVTIDDTNLMNIADAIREKNGTSNIYKPSEMASAIQNISAKEALKCLSPKQRVIIIYKYFLIFFSAPGL